MKLEEDEDCENGDAVREVMGERPIFRAGAKPKKREKVDA